MDAFARQFGAKIKQCRTERGMTQAELATAAEVGPNYVPRIERGEMTPSVDAAYRLSRALGLSLDEACSIKGKRDPVGSAARQLAALSDVEVAGMKRTLEAVETLRKSLRDPAKPKAEPALSAKKRILKRCPSANQVGARRRRRWAQQGHLLVAHPRGKLAKAGARTRSTRRAAGRYETCNDPCTRPR